VSTKTGTIVEKMFGDVANNPVELSKRFDNYKKALGEVPWGQFDNAGQTVKGNLRIKNTEKSATGQLIEVEKTVSHVDQMRALLKQDTINKALGNDDLLSSLTAALGAQDDITKDINLTSPVSTGLVLFDLKAPAEFLVPVETPLRNRFPRTQGVGTSFRYKQITGITNAQTTAGLAQLHPGIADSVQTDFRPPGGANAEWFNRGPKISYAGQDQQAAYFQFGLSDEVTWSAQFAGVGFEDVRQLSQTSVLYSSMLAEERMTVYGRGIAGNGYSGTITTPTATIAARAAAGSETAVPGTPTVDVWVAATTGFGTAPAVVATPATVTLTAGQVVDVTIPATAGATGYLVFVGTTAGAANAFYYGTFSGSMTITGVLPTTGQNAGQFSTNTSAQSIGYDGILPICTGANAGYVKNIGGLFNTAKPGSEFQTAFAAMYAQNLANPDSLLFNGSDRKQLSDSIQSQGNPNGYRLTLDADGLGGHKLGSIVTGIQNEVTGKLVDLEVHPYMPQGTVPILTNELPFPNSNVSSCWEYRNVQDYMGVNWPVLQFTYDTSSYWYGTFFCHAPAWQGAITGVKNG